MKITRFLTIALALATGLTFYSCGDDNDGIQLGGGGQGGGGSTEPVVPSSTIASRMETPEILTDGSTLTLSHSTKEGNKEVMTYCLEYDKTKLHSRWVAFRFDGDTRPKTVSRSSDGFFDDPELPSNLQIGSNSYSGYDRGHICASADRLYSAAANNNTFYMSNMSPQLANFNQGYWVTLEGLVQSLGRNTSFSDTLYVVKGGTIADDQIIRYVSRPNGKKVAVPKYYYMALLKIKNGVYSSIAFLLEHKDYGYSSGNQAPKSEMRTHAMSVNALEAFTGINFFPNLPDDKEESIEDQCLPTNWGM